MCQEVGKGQNVLREAEEEAILRNIHQLHPTWSFETPNLNWWYPLYRDTHTDKRRVDRPKALTKYGHLWNNVVVNSCNNTYLLRPCTLCK